MPVILCDFCDEEVDTRAAGSFKKVVGWVQNRKQGGAHAVTLPSAPLAWAHLGCVEIEKRNPIHRNSDTLF